MRYQKLSWLGSLALFGIIASTSSVSAQTNQSDTTGTQTFSAPAVSVDGQSPTFDLGSLSGSGAGSSSQVSYSDAASVLGKGLSTSLDNLAAIQQGGPVTAAAPNSGPRRIARRSSSHACGCANPASTASNDGPRRIVRQVQGAGKSCCANPTIEAGNGKYRVIQARKMVEEQLDASKKFIEQVNQTDSRNSIW